MLQLKSMILICQNTTTLDASKYKNKAFQAMCHILNKATALNHVITSNCRSCFCLVNHLY